MHAVERVPELCLHHPAHLVREVDLDDFNVGDIDKVEWDSDGKDDMDNDDLTNNDNDGKYDMDNDDLNDNDNDGGDGGEFDNDDLTSLDPKSGRRRLNHPVHVLRLQIVIRYCHH